MGSIQPGSEGEGVKRVAMYICVRLIKYQFRNAVIQFEARRLVQMSIVDKEQEYATLAISVGVPHSDVLRI
jgi:uncharacterized protein YtpQ (UPF0354 family)